VSCYRAGEKVWADKIDCLWYIAFLIIPYRRNKAKIIKKVFWPNFFLCLNKTNGNLILGKQLNVFFFSHYCLVSHNFFLYLAQSQFPSPILSLFIYLSTLIVCLSLCLSLFLSLSFSLTISFSFISLSPFLSRSLSFPFHSFSVCCDASDKQKNLLVNTFNNFDLTFKTIWRTQRKRRSNNPN